MKKIFLFQNSNMLNIKLKNVLYLVLSAFFLYSCAIDVPKEPVPAVIKKTGIVISTDKTALSPYEILSMNVQIEPANATETSIKWTIVSGSENANIDIDKGTISPVSNGEIRVQAVDSNASADKENPIKSNEITITINGFITSLAVTTENDITEITENGKTLKVLANILPDDIDKTLSWFVSPELSAAIDPAAGIVTPLSNGDVVITAVYAPDPKIIRKINLKFSNQVIPATTLTIVKPTEGDFYSITSSGGTQALSAVVAPLYSTSTLTWSLVPADSDIAIISNSGVVTARKNGEITAVVTSSDDETVKDTILIKTSNQVAVTSIGVARKTDKEDTNAVVGTDLDLTTIFDITFTPANAADKNVIWSVAGGRASISQQGVLKPLTTGASFIKITSGSDSTISSGFIRVEIVAESINVASVAISKKTGQSASIDLGEGTVDLTKIFNVTVLPANATNKAVKWLLTGTQATVSENGILTALSPGTVQVQIASASDASKTSAFLPFIINNYKPVTGITLKRKTGQESAIASVGGGNVDLNDVFNVVFEPASVTNKSIVWSLSNGDATISDAGILTPINKAVVQVKVTSTSETNISSEWVSFSIGDYIAVTSITLNRKMDQADKTATVGLDNVDLNSVFDVVVEPANAVIKTFTWSVTPETTATIVATTGVLSPVSAGVVQVTVTSVSETTVSTVMPFTIDPNVAVTSIVVSRKADQTDTSATVGAGTVDLKDVFNVVVEPSNATIANVTWAVTGAEATVTSEGILTPVSGGIVQVVVTSVSQSDISSTPIPFTINANVAVASITVARKADQVDTEVAPGTTKVDLTTIFDVTVLPANATNKGIKWELDDWDVEDAAPTLTNDGMLTPSSGGVVKLIVSSVSNSTISSSVMPLTISKINVETLSLQRKTEKQDTAATVGGNNVDLTAIFDITFVPENASNKQVTWSLTGEAATVTAGGTLTAVSVGTVQIKITSQADNTKVSEELPFTINPAPAKVTAIRLIRKSGQENTKATVNGDVVDLRTVFDIEFTPKDFSDQRLFWSATGPGVVSLTSGFLSPLAAGVMTIKVTSRAESSITSANVLFEVVVQPATGITLARKTSQADTKAYVSGASVDLNDVFDVQIAPANTSVKTFTWSVMGDAATVTSSGVLTPVKEGTVQVTVTSVSDNKVVSTELPFVIEKVLPTSIVVTRKAGLETKTITAGEGSIDLNAIFDIEVLPKTSFDKATTWSVTGSGAVVTPSGLLNPMTAGTIQLTVTSVAAPTVESAPVPITVDSKIEVASISLTRKADQVSTVALLAGGDVDLATIFDISVLPASATDSRITWSVTPETVATVIATTGMLTPVSAGTVQVTVASVSDTTVMSTAMPLLVSAAVPMTSITLVRKAGNTTTAATDGVAVDLTTVFDVNVMPANATVKTVKWSLTGDGATITDAGVLKPTAAGTVQVKVTSVSTDTIESAELPFVIKTAVALTGISLSRKTGQEKTVANVGGVVIDLNTVFDVNVLPATTTVTNTAVSWSLTGGAAGVTKEGILYPILAGTVHITATLIGDSSIVSNSASFEVLKIATDITLSRKAGQSNTMAIIGVPLNLANVFNVETTPSGADASIIWTVATDSAVTGTISGTELTASAAGVITLVATSVSAPSLNKRVTVTATLPPATGVTIDALGAGITPTIGTGLQLSASVTPDAAAQTVTWEIMPAVNGYSINPNGMLMSNTSTAMPGDVIVVASSGTVRSTPMTLTYVRPAATRVTIDTVATPPVLGTSVTLSATVAPAGSVQTVTWSIPAAVNGYSIDATTGELSSMTSATALTVDVVATSGTGASAIDSAAMTITFVRPSAGIVTIAPVTGGGTIGTTLQLSATVGTAGAAPITWAITSHPGGTDTTYSISPTGLLTSTTAAIPGDVVVVATSGTVNSNPMRIAYVRPSAGTVTIAPITGGGTIGVALQLSASVGTAGAAPITWAITSHPGGTDTTYSISPTGLITSTTAAIPGDVVVVATSGTVNSNPMRIAYVRPSAGTVTIAPITGGGTIGVALQLSASVGTAGAAPITWAITSHPGVTDTTYSISPTGLLTSTTAAIPGDVVVVATSGTVNSTPMTIAYVRPSAGTVTIAPITGGGTIGTALQLSASVGTAGAAPITWAITSHPGGTDTTYSISPTGLLTSTTAAIPGDVVVVATSGTVNSTPMTIAYVRPSAGTVTIAPITGGGTIGTALQLSASVGTAGAAPITWAITSHPGVTDTTYSISPTGLLTSTTAAIPGDVVVVATSGTVNSTPMTIAYVRPSAGTVTIAPITGGGTIGADLQLSATVGTAGAAPITWAITSHPGGTDTTYSISPTGLLTSTTAAIPGDVVVVATSGTVNSTPMTIAYVRPSAGTVTIAPITGGGTIGADLQLSATVGTAGAAPITWAITSHPGGTDTTYSISPTGLLTSTTAAIPGDVVVVASSGTVNSTPMTIAYVRPSAGTVTIAPITGGGTIGTALQLSATVGTAGAAPITWAITSHPGGTDTTYSISPTGLLTSTTAAIPGDVVVVASSGAVDSQPMTITFVSP